MGVIYILWLRELKRYSRSRAQMIASLGQPFCICWRSGFGHGSCVPRRRGMEAICNFWRQV